MDAMNPQVIQTFLMRKGVNLETFNANSYKTFDDFVTEWEELDIALGLWKVEPEGEEPDVFPLTVRRNVKGIVADENHEWREVSRTFKSGRTLAKGRREAFSETRKIKEKPFSAIVRCLLQERKVSVTPDLIVPIRSHYKPEEVRLSSVFHLIFSRSIPDYFYIRPELVGFGADDIELDDQSAKNLVRRFPLSNETRILLNRNKILLKT